MRGALVTFLGCDLSHCGTGTLVGNQASYANVFKFIQCKLGTNYVAQATPSSPANAANGQTWIMDCASGDTHGLFGFYNGQGALTSDTGVYVTDGAAQQSWKIVTTRERARAPILDAVDFTCTTRRRQASRPTSTFSATIARLRTRDTEVWAEFAAKTAGASPISTIYSDAGRLSAGTNQASSSLGAGDWTGESGTNWYGKCDSGAAFATGGEMEILGGFAWPWHRRRFGLIRKSRPDDCVSRVSVGGVWVQGDDSAASSRVGAGDVWLQVAAAAGAGNTLSPGTGHLVLTGYVPSIDRQDGHFLSPGTGHLADRLCAVDHARRRNNAIARNRAPDADRICPIDRSRRWAFPVTRYWTSHPNRSAAVDHTGRGKHTFPGWDISR